MGVSDTRARVSFLGQCGRHDPSAAAKQKAFGSVEMTALGMIAGRRRHVLEKINRDEDGKICVIGLWHGQEIYGGTRADEVHDE